MLPTQRVGATKPKAGSQIFPARIWSKQPFPNAPYAQIWLQKAPGQDLAQKRFPNAPEGILDSQLKAAKVLKSRCCQDLAFPMPPDT